MDTLLFFYLLEISIHALREEGDRCRTRAKMRGEISIHALREEGDPTAWWPLLMGTYFYPRPPRGGRHMAIFLSLALPEFLSTPSARRATYVADAKAQARQISIHALREEGDLTTQIRQQEEFISIHALREEGDTPTRIPASTHTYFYPRPPRGGRRPQKHRQRQTV